MIYTSRNFRSTSYFRWTFDIYIPQLISTFLHTNTWWYIHTATLYLLFCRWTRGSIYIPQRYINYQLSHRWTREDICKLQLYINMRYTYGDFISTFLQVNTWWYTHTASLNQLSCRWTREDICKPQLYINVNEDEHMIIYTCSNFYQLSCRWTRDDIYIPQLYINFSADEHVIIYTCRNFISTFLQMSTWWDIYTATLDEPFWKWTRDNVCILQTLYQLSCRWARDDIYIPQLFIDFPAHEHVMIYTYRNFISSVLQMNTW